MYVMETHHIYTKETQHIYVLESHQISSEHRSNMSRTQIKYLQDKVQISP